MNLRRTAFFGCIFVLGVLMGSLITTSVHAQRRVGKTQMLLTQDLQGFCDGKEVVVELFEGGPGTSGKHYHRGYSFSWAIDGTEVEKVEGKPPLTVHAGEVAYQGPMQVHENENQGAVRKLTFRILEKGKPHTTQVGE
jgi:hypothetical protein